MSKREDCYFYREDHDMGATIPYCVYNFEGWGICPCSKECKHYISGQDAFSIVKEYVDKRENDEFQ